MIKGASNCLWHAWQLSCSFSVLTGQSNKFLKKLFLFVFTCLDINSRAGRPTPVRVLQSLIQSFVVVGHYTSAHQHMPCLVANVDQTYVWSATASFKFVQENSSKKTADILVE